MQLDSPQVSHSLRENIDFHFPVIKRWLALPNAENCTANAKFHLWIESMVSRRIFYFTTIECVSEKNCMKIEAPRNALLAVKYP